jgi:GTP-binding protein
VPVVLVANKAKGARGEGGLIEAYALGLGDPVAVSAEHGEGLADLVRGVAAASRRKDAEPRATRSRRIRPQGVSSWRSSAGPMPASRR